MPEGIGGEVEAVEGGEVGGEGPGEHVMGEVKVEVDEQVWEGAGELAGECVGGEVEHLKAAKEGERWGRERTGEVEAWEGDRNDRGRGRSGRRVVQDAELGRRERATPGGERRAGGQREGRTGGEELHAVGGGGGHGVQCRDEEGEYEEERKGERSGR